MTKRSARQKWEAIEKQAIEAEMDRILALSDEALDEELREAGFDPKAEGEKGVAMATELIEHRAEQSWQAEADAKLHAVQSRFASRVRGEKLSRAELEKRIAIARNDPRLAQPVAVMFRNRPTEKATDEELEAMLEEIEALADKAE